MHVLFVEPAFPANQREFVRGLHAAGALVTGIGEASLEALDPELKSWMHAYEQVRSVVHEPSMLEAVRRCQARGWVDRLEATVEAHVMAAARVREQCGIPGTSVRTAHLCRDKPAMKQVLREAGIPCAQSIGSDSADEVRRFAAKVGLPIILKPRDGAGASDTFRASTPAELEQAITGCGVDRGRSIAVEEFIEGHEGFYDTITVDGRIRHEFISHYYPTVLVAMRERWISPQFIATNRLDSDGYDELRRMAVSVNDALGIDTSPTHMEWFAGPKGLKFSEIGCRPPGVDAWDVYVAGNEFDIYREWALAIMGQPAAERPSRRFAAGHVALRPERDGRIVGYSGVEAMQRDLAPFIVATHLPAPGSSTQPVEAGYKANAWVRLRHPDYDELRRLLTHVGESVRVHAA